MEAVVETSPPSNKYLNSGLFKNNTVKPVHAKTKRIITT